MSWDKQKAGFGRTACAAALVLAIGGGAALAEPAVVVKSSANGFPVGSKVDDADMITLESGDSVTVLTNKGTRTMRGPGTFEVGAQPRSNRARFANLTRKRASTRSSTGAVRGTNEAGEETRPLNPNLYYVDVEQSGTLCLYDLAEVRLWRPYADGIATYQLSGPAMEGPIEVTFDDRQSVAPLDPAVTTLVEGKSYTLTAPGGGETVTFEFADLGQEFNRADQLAAVLADKGCMSQLTLMGEKLAG